MVVGSSAAAGYDDVKETDNVEAIEVLQAVEVMVGDDRGFGPDRPVNCAEMAVVMGKLLNLDYNYYERTCPFTDVSSNYAWAKNWVGACAANGIVSGCGNGIYDPGATVTVDGVNLLDGSNSFALTVAVEDADAVITPVCLDNKLPTPTVDPADAKDENIGNKAIYLREVPSGGKVGNLELNLSTGMTVVVPVTVHRIRLDPLVQVVVACVVD